MPLNAHVAFPAIFRTVLSNDIEKTKESKEVDRNRGIDIYACWGQA
jgi:hypothetical protein